MSYGARVLSLTPLLYLPLDETSGSTFVDATGNGHAATIALPAYVTVGGADSFLTGEKGAAFTQSGAEIDFAAGSGFGTVGHFTLEYWVQVIANAIDTFDVGFRFDGTHNIFADLSEQGPANALAVEVDWHAAPTSAIAIGETISVPHVNCWNHWAFTYDGVRVQTYLNGVLVDPALTSSLPALSFTPSGGGKILNSGGPTSAFNLVQVAFYPSALSDADVAANYAAATPRQDSGCFATPIRLRHSLGHVVFESDDTTTRLRTGNADVLTHDGTTMNVFSGGAPKLQVPIPAAPTPPTRWVGVDPAGGLTVHDVLPTPATHGLSPLVPPVPVVTTSLTCNQLRCGAASNMRLHLEELYNNWATVLGGAVKLGEILGAIAAIAALGELVAGAAILGEFAEDVFAAIRPTLQLWIGTIVPNPFPDITIPGDTMIWNGAYCQLTCSGNVVDPTSVQVQAWNTYITNNSSALVGPSLQLALLNALLDFTPLLDWQAAASSAVANAGCAGFICP